MKTLDEYIMFVEIQIYDFISWTGVWLTSPAISIGPFDSVIITIGHIFMLYFIISGLAVIWFTYRLNIKEKYEQY